MRRCLKTKQDTHFNCLNNSFRNDKIAMFSDTFIFYSFRNVDHFFYCDKYSKGLMNEAALFNI